MFCSQIEQKKENCAFVVVTLSLMGVLSWGKKREKSSCFERKKGRSGRSHSWLLQGRQHCGCHRNQGHYRDHFPMAPGQRPGKKHSVPGLWTELSVWVAGGEHQNLPEGWEAEAEIPDPSRSTPTPWSAACVSPGGERLGTILPPPVLFCTGECWSHCPGGELWDSGRKGGR